MKKTTSNKRLLLSKEKVRSLDDVRLSQVAGAGQTYEACWEIPSESCSASYKPTANCWG